MTSSRQSRTNYGRRFFWFAVAIALACLAYTGGWFYAARFVEDEVKTTLAALNGNGRRANCEEAQARGYPFRIGVFCRSVMYEDAAGGVGLRARAFRSAAQVYAPHRALAELDGPGRLEVPGLTALDLHWASMRASTRLAMPLPDLFSLESRELEVRLDEPGDVSPLLWSAEVLEFHMRPAGDDLDLASRFTRLRLAPGFAPMEGFPAFNGLVDFQLAEGALLHGARADLRGRSGMLRTAALSIDGTDAGATIRGPVSIDTAGLIDADLELTLRDPAAIADLLVALFPEASREIALSAAGIAAMGNEPTLPLRIRRGEVSLGIFTLGVIPPI